MGLGRNIELKARNLDPDRSREVCRGLGAEDRGILAQRDTYFHVPSGRLKLREESGAPAHLIAYSRPDVERERESRYRIVAVGDPDEMKQALAETLGIEVVVEKRRHLFLWQNVRIHLDDVEGLGNFIEFEAVAPPDSDLSKEHKQVQVLREAFGIEESHLIAESYCDLQSASLTGVD
jgi:predicted adenylyl cyclase CyaB